MAKPLISFTLRLPESLTGSKLRDITEAVAESNSALFCEPDPANLECLLIGQRSGYRHHQLLVGASAEQPGIKLDAVYDEVTVLSYDQGQGFDTYYADDQVVRAVWAFASELFDRLLGRNSYSEAKLRSASQ